MSSSRPHLATNPFATRWVRPGALAYQFGEGQSAAALLERLAQNDWWGQIVGPDGSGKSVLLATLLPLVEGAGRRTHLCTLHDRQHRLPINVRADIPSPSSALLAIDGYEQLSRFNRWRLLRWVRRRGCGLLVTTHTPENLPLLYRTTTSARLAEQLVLELLEPGDRTINAEDVRQLFALREGDLRETFFDLYDLYEARRRRNA
jgi:hypothetical protein